MGDSVQPTPAAPAGLLAEPERRWTVLAHVAAHTFTPGADYDERTVNELLAGRGEAMVRGMGLT